MLCGELCRINVLFRSWFDADLYADTEMFYIRESVEFLRQNPVTEYMKKAERRLKEEEKRVLEYLHETTLQRLLVTCDKVCCKSRYVVNHAVCEMMLSRKFVSSSFKNDGYL